MFKQSFKMFLESKELGVLRPRPLSPVELNKAKSSISAALAIHDLIKTNKSEVKPVTIQALHDKLKRYSKIKFVKHLVDELDKMLHSHRQYELAGEKVMTKHGETKKRLQDMKAAFMAKDFKKSKEHKDALDKHLNDIDHSIDIGSRSHTMLSNRYKTQPSIFGTTRLLSHIDDSDYDKLRALDLGKPLFTAIDFPASKEDDFDYVLYFLTHLLDSPKPIRIDAEHDFRLHSKVSHASNDKYEELMKLMDRYLHSNDKELIPKIVKLINAVPSIREANEKAKLKHKIVYRGLGFGEGDDTSHEEIIAREHEQKYVATSESKRAAKNFALQKGHLESEDSRRSNYGVIIVYKVTPASVLFDTKVVDTVYNESEILIDATKAEIVEILEV